MAKEAQGLSLSDIGVPSEQVPIGDQFVTVTGIAAEDIFTLLQRFPSVISVISGSVKIADIAGIAPESIGAVIAAGTGSPGEEAAERVARRLPIETQLDILQVIGRLTFKNGFGPFVTRIVALINDTAAASESFGKATGMSLQPQLKPSSPQDSITEPSGP